MSMNTEEILARATADVDAAADLRALDAVRVSFLGKKGELTSLLKGLGQLDPSDRPAAGALINEVKQQLQNAINDRSRARAVAVIRSAERGGC